MTFHGNLHDLYDMQQAAASEVLAKYRPQSAWLGRDSEYLDDPENPDEDPCAAVEDFELRQQERWAELEVKAWEAEEKTEERWWRRLAYDEFLRSEYWDSVRQAIIRRDKHKCRACGSTEKLQVHHRWYPPRGTELQHLDALILLCSKCHREHHQ